MCHKCGHCLIMGTFISALLFVEFFEYESGNTSQYIGDDNSDYCTHSWCIYIRRPEGEPSIGEILQKVRFHLDPSYKPNDVAEVIGEPFSLTKRGWGEFPIKIEMFFKCNEKPVAFLHHLQLDKLKTGRYTLESETAVEVVLYRNPTHIDNIIKNTYTPEYSFNIGDEEKQEPIITNVKQIIEQNNALLDVDNIKTEDTGDESMQKDVQSFNTKALEYLYMENQVFLHCMDKSNNVEYMLRFPKQIPVFSLVYDKTLYKQLFVTQLLNRDSDKPTWLPIKNKRSDKHTTIPIKSEQPIGNKYSDNRIQLPIEAKHPDKSTEIPIENEYPAHLKPVNLNRCPVVQPMLKTNVLSENKNCDKEVNHIDKVAVKRNCFKLPDLPNKVRIVNSHSITESKTAAKPLTQYSTSLNSNKTVTTSLLKNSINPNRSLLKKNSSQSLLKCSYLPKRTGDLDNKIAQNKFLLSNNLVRKTNLLSETKDHQIIIVRKGNSVLTTQAPKIFLKNRATLSSERKFTVFNPNTYETFDKDINTLKKVLKQLDISHIIAYALKRIPLYKTSQNMHRLFFDVPTLEQFKNYSLVKQSFLEITRAKYICEFLKKLYTKVPEDWNYASIVRFGREQGFLPKDHKYWKNIEMKLNAKSSGKDLQKIEPIDSYTSPDDLLNYFSKKINAIPKHIFNSDFVDVETVSHTEVKKYVPKESASNSFLLPILYGSTGEWQLVMHAAKSVGVKFEPEQLINGINHLSALEVLCSVLKSFVSDVIRKSLGVCQLQEAGEILPEHIFASLLSRPEFDILTNKNLGSEL